MAERKYDHEDPQLASRVDKESNPGDGHDHHLPTLGTVEYPSDTALVDGHNLHVAGESLSHTRFSIRPTDDLRRCQEDRGYRLPTGQADPTPRFLRYPPPRLRYEYRWGESQSFHALHGYPSQ